MDHIFGRLSWRAPVSGGGQSSAYLRESGAPWLLLSSANPLGRQGAVIVSLDASGASPEPIALAYQQNKSRFLQSVTGSFSFALWDEDEKKLIIARDRVGRRPLWWSFVDGVFSFSSSLSDVSGPIDEAAVRSYLRWGYIAAPLSGFSGWSLLPPGCFVTMSANGVREPRPYWDLRVPPRVSRCHDATSVIAQRARSLLLRSTETSGRAAIVVRTGALSSALLASNPGAFDACFLATSEEATQNIDRVRELAAHHKAPCRAVVYQPGGGELPSVEQLFHHIYGSLESPCADILLPEKMLAIEFAHQSDRVVISSLGENFLFGIEDEYQSTAKVERLPGAARRLISRAASWLPRRFFDGEQVTALRQEVNFRRFSLAQKIEARRVLFETETPEDLQSLASCVQAPRGAKLNDRLFYTAFKRELPDECIAPVEQLTRKKELRLLLPYCGVEVAELAATMPKKLESGAWLKKIFPEAPRSFIHEAQPAVGSWIRGPLRSLFFDVLGAPNAKVTRFVASDLIHQLLTNHHSSKQDNSHQLLALFSLELWMKRAAQ